jgi:hypothetical protein
MSGYGDNGGCLGGFSRGRLLWAGVLKGDHHGHAVGTRVREETRAFLGRQLHAVFASFLQPFQLRADNDGAGLTGDKLRVLVKVEESWEPGEEGGACLGCVPAESGT